MDDMRVTADDERVTAVLSDGPLAPAEARRVVQAVLVEWGFGDLAADAELMVSEMVTNAFLHASGPTELRVRRNEVVTVEVADHSPVDLVLGRTDSTRRVGGLGLRIIDRLARRWGAREVDDGKVLWFELARSPE
ncbi:MAG: ATP-binding protein [Acidimicrobiales bacterium]|jgi:anti-sigma regulatory factor (Ser/Thr protein kinase)|nr:ATP-binding protein [Acidimicrobiales bacterium]